MAKYNITEKKEKEAAYRTLVSPGLMDEFKEKILDIAQYKDEFITGLKQLTEEIFDSSKPFLPTDDKSRCETCIYKSICG